MQHGDLDKTEVPKTQRDSMSDERKPKFQCGINSFLPVRPVLHTGQTGWTYYRISPVHQTYLIPYLGSIEVSLICPAPSPDMSGLSTLTRVKSQESDMPGSRAGFQRDFPDVPGLEPDMSGELYDRCNLNSTGLVRVLTQLCHLREISSVSGLSRFGVFIPI
jgi:hypothetical protein